VFKRRLLFHTSLLLRDGEVGLPKQEFRTGGLMYPAEGPRYVIEPPYMARQAREKPDSRAKPLAQFIGRVSGTLSCCRRRRPRLNNSNAKDFRGVDRYISEVSHRNLARRARVRDENGKLELRPGQPALNCLFDVEMEQRICGFIADGMSYLDSAKLAGIDPVTLYRWRTKGEEEPDSRFGEFLQSG
jgi:hypothetical protein